MMKTVEESQFAEQVTALLHEVIANGAEVLITRGGRAVAKVAPAEGKRYPTLESFRGSVQIVSDIVEPAEPDWDILK